MLKKINVKLENPHAQEAPHAKPPVGGTQDEQERLQEQLQLRESTSYQELQRDHSDEEGDQDAPRVKSPTLGKVEEREAKRADFPATPFGEQEEQRQPGPGSQHLQQPKEV